MIPILYLILGAIVGCMAIVFLYLNAKIDALASPAKQTKKRNSPQPLKEIRKDSPVYSISYFSDAVAQDDFTNEDLTQTEIQKIKEVPIEEETDPEIEEIIENLSDDE